MQHWSKVIVDDALWSCSDCPDHLRRALKRMADIISEQPYHSFRLPEVERYADEIAECTDLTTLIEYMWRASTTLGFQNVTIFALAQGENSNFRTRVCTSHNQDWIRQYQEKRYQFIDPVVAMAEQRDGSFVFGDLPNDAPVVQAFWEDAERHRIGRNGLCVAVTRRNGARVGVSYSTSIDGEATEKLLRLNGHDLEFLAILATDCFCELSVGPDLSDNLLTDAELRFLYMLSTSSDHNVAMNITNGYGSNANLQASIRAKLGVESIFQAIAIAVSLRWFDRMPYGEADLVQTFPKLQGLEVLNDVPSDA